MGDLLKTILGAVVPGVGNYLGAREQRKASEEALAYEKERDKYARQTEANRYGAMTKDLSSYVSSGSASDARMAALLGLPPPGPSAASTPPVTPSPALRPRTPSPNATYTGHVAVPRPDFGLAPTGAGAAPGGGGAPGPMVTMQAPDGTTKQVPASEQAHWEQTGAVKVA